MIYKYCRRCGRRLEGEENRRRGYGETCFEKAQREAKGTHPLVPLMNSDAEQSKTESRAEDKAENSSRENLNIGRPPHLETTLTPTSKKPFLFRPHTDPHPHK